jgi:ribosome-associated protein
MLNTFKTSILSQSDLVARESAPQRFASEVDSYNLAITAAEAADDRKGGNILLLNVSEVSYLADYFVVVTGFSSVQVKAIARSIEDKLLEQWQRSPLQVEGVNEGTWVLMDYGDLIVHIFMPKEREFYNLEAFWSHAERIPYIPSSPLLS